MLKKSFIILFSILFSILLVSCDQEVELTIENPIGIVYKNNKPYIVNDKNELLSLEQYETIVPFFDDILIVKKNNLYGYINANGSVLSDCIYTEAYPFKEDKAVVRQNNTLMIIDKNLNTLYTFDRNISSTSSFSEGKLVVSKTVDNITKYKYLSYNDQTNSFELLDDLSFDYCGDFVNSMAKVGKLDENNVLKYTFINSSFKTISDYIFDEVSNFSEGFAKVGIKQKYETLVYCGNMNKFDETARTSTNITTYYYISTTGNYLAKNSVTPKLSEALAFASANDFRDGIALVANLYFYTPKYDDERWNGTNYDYTTNKFFYNYDFITLDGETLIPSDIAIANNWGGAVSMYNDVAKVGNYYVTTYYQASWKVQYLNFTSSNGFLNIDWEIDLVKSNDDLPWINTFISEFASLTSTHVFVADCVTNPYNISNIKKSKFINDQYVLKTQIFTGSYSKCGVISITTKDDSLLVTYVIPPLYDEVVY